MGFKINPSHPRGATPTEEPISYTPQFNEPIFMGCGEDSLAECRRAHALLDQIFEMISGLQQPQPITSEPDDPTVRRADESVLSEMFEDLAQACGFGDVTNEGALWCPDVKRNTSRR